MQPIVADTTPLNYLVLIQAADILPELYRTVLIPPAVKAELAHIGMPECVPSNALLQFGFPRGWADVVSHDCMCPIRKLALGMWPGKDPVFSGAVRSLTTPC